MSDSEEAMRHRDSTASAVRLGLFSVLFSLTIAFSITDLLTTASALRDSLSEGNSLIISLANFLNLGVLATLGITKIFFIAASALSSIIGVTSSDPRVRIRMVILMVILVVLLFLVSANNLFWITSRI